MRILILLLLLVSSPALALDTPTSYVHSNVDAVVSILASPEYKDEATRDAAMEKIEKVVDGFFESEELSKRALGQYWRIFNKDQRAEFQVLFLELIKQVYLKKSVAYNDEVVVYNQEILKSDTQAEVQTTISSPELNIPVVYYMVRRDAAWKVYDVAVENVSLVKNYRSQFQSILQNNPPEKLIDILREKTNE
jgi:phospholipid transport system substrate-binding protein